jgi:hypothetical protein
MATLVQCGARRSGNYLLWRVVGLLLGREGTYDEFLASVGRAGQAQPFTHDLPEKVEVPGLYVVRDGRDAVASLLHYVVTPAYRERHPDCTRTSVAELLQLEGFFRRRVLHWQEHVASYLADPRPWRLVRYEELSGPGKPAVVRQLADWLEVPLETERLEAILRLTSVGASRTAAPGHVHSGHAGGHRELFDEELLATFHDLAGRELEALGYR